ncbi:MAG: creatininase family protein [Anaerolineales bacterium]|nr:creatininase family protein [Anaerolineales bacterium]
MRFESLNWFDVEKYLEKDDRLMIVLGSCEQHGYLSLLSDVKIPLALADAASQKTGVLVAPPLNFGVSPYFLAYPGTISIRVSTMLDLIEDFINSVWQHGFRKLLILNGHGGNDVVRGKLYELVNLHPDLEVAWYAWWHSHSIEKIAQKHELKLYHASWLEAFPFTIVSELPDGKKLPPYVPGLVSAKDARQIYGDGVFGGAYQTKPEIMDEIFQAAVEDILFLLNFS